MKPSGHTEDANDKELVVVLDIGFSGSTLVVIKGGTPLFSRRFSLGGRELTDILVQSLMVDWDQAQSLNKVYGLSAYHAGFDLKEGETQNGQSENDSNNKEPRVKNAQIAKTILSALQPHLESFLEGLIRSLNYVIAQQRGSRLEKILLCGTASHLHKLECYFTDKLGIPVERMRNRLLSEITEQLPEPKAQTGRWTTALGLALYREEFDSTGSNQSAEKEIPIVDGQVLSGEVSP